MKLHPGPWWRNFHILTCEDIDDVILSLEDEDVILSTIQFVYKAAKRTS